MSRFNILFLFTLTFIRELLGHNEVSGSGTTLHSSYNEVVPEEEYYTPRLDYRNPRWCHFLSLANGDVTCHSPRGGNYRSTLGTRCEMTCDRGYKLLGRTSVQCMPNRRWSGTSHCRQVRCNTLHLIWHGTYHCTQGYMVDSRCDYICEPGYRIEGDHSRTCLDRGSWSGAEPICEDHDPPKIKCPMSRVKVAEPGKLTARVSWDPPVATDTADKTLDVMLIGQRPDTNFKEGINIIRYTAHDQAGNRAACKFIVRVEVRRCPVLKTPLHGYLTCDSDGNNYGAVCEYHCDGGHERRGTSSRVCQFDRSWTEAPAECVTMEFKTDVNTASALLDQFYDKRRLLIVSAPNVAHGDYKLQNLMVQADCGLDLRQVTVIELLGSPPREVGRIKGRHLDTEVIEGLRQAFRISRSYFNMVLLDKDGLDHERFITPTTSDELFSYIDDNLLDEEERRRLELHRDYCD
ncbi:sushi repeat-containing protein SRPX2 isoform X2 [Salmo salar]|uniref:Sushi repeat-containing protein SRPX2 n=1 Tax=Salmo salar TaxID=8030 RepID=A0A1S3STL2_SALSA|nr:sushi repeat-containing protein SRPX2 isoform X2 [Salmo salar]